MRSRLRRLLCDREFETARLTVYAVAYAMLAAALLAPLDYSCSDSDLCPACGFRAAVASLAALDLPPALASSALVVPATILAVLAVADSIAILARRLRAREKPSL